MDINALRDTVKMLVAPGKGILAADESEKTIEKRLTAVGLQSTEEIRRSYRQLLFKTPGINKYISGVILFDETIRQSTDEGIPFAKYLSDHGIIPGIKVDKGTKELTSGSLEKITEGLDGLSERLVDYKNMGAQFAKWRAVIAIGGQGIPTDGCIKQNSERLASFAKACQENDLIPIVEPEVLMDGDHSIERCEEVTYKTLKTVFSSLESVRVDYSAMLLKSNMVVQAKENLTKATSQEIAKATLRCFSEVIPETLPGIVFLSGGQTPQEATENLNEMNKLGFRTELSFSYGRALQEPVLKAWTGDQANIETAQSEFLKRAKLNSFARYGKYLPEMEDV